MMSVVLYRLNRMHSQGVEQSIFGPQHMDKFETSIEISYLSFHFTQIEICFKFLHIVKKCFEV